MKQTISLYTSIAIALFLSSCKDDPAMVAKSQSQKEQIAKLEGEIALLNEKVANPPPDRTHDLAELIDKIGKQKEEIESLQKTVADLQDKKKKTEDEFKAYQQKYPLSR